MLKTKYKNKVDLMPKYDQTDNLEVKAKDVYDGMLKSLTGKGHQLTDISRAGLNSFIRTMLLIK